jgi:hypothetical protein
MGRFVIGPSHALAAAARGLNAAQADFAAAGQSIARTESVSLERAVVDAKLAEARIHANAAVVRTIDDMLGSLVDTLA